MEEVSNKNIVKLSSVPIEKMKPVAQIDSKLGDLIAILNQATYEFESDKIKIKALINRGCNSGGII